MNNELIVVKQLPVIQEQLQQAKKAVSARVEAACSLVCNEDTVKSVKEERAKLNKEFKLWEEKRKGNSLPRFVSPTFSSRQNCESSTMRRLTLWKFAAEVVGYILSRSR